MDKIIIDIETSNTFADVGGDKNIKDLNASFVGVYSYNEKKYLSFFEQDFKELGKLLQKTGLIIGFAINRFDIPVMEKYFDFSLRKIENLDILDEIERVFGRRVGLGILAEANLGAKKTGHGLQAIDMFKEGRMEDLKNYCLNDVKLTKDLYELIKKQKYILIPNKITGQNDKVVMDFNDSEPLMSLF